MAESNQAVIIKKVKKVHGHAHHGGAWKVAYADFVTAMMAFFLLLWLLNVTTDVQKKGIADYFAPASMSRTESGAGSILGGQTLVTEGSRASTYGVPSVVVAITPPPGRKSEATEREPDDANTRDDKSTEDKAGDNKLRTEKQFEKAMVDREQKAFEQAQAQLKQAIEETPELAELKRQIIVDMTPEGLRVQIVDRENQSMFPTGSAQMNDRARLLLQKIAQVVGKLPNKISISGHTDATPYRTENGYGNWELSTDRANASRRVLIDSGLAQDRIKQVVGRADQDPLVAKDPLDPTNRRIAIVLLRQAPLSTAQNGATPDNQVPAAPGAPDAKAVAAQPAAQSPGQSGPAPVLPPDKARSVNR
ncbi:MAG TPA: flagellar motor protein MotB [Candidatus Cybelea sp.]|nr:flagellar motor protein MotB [Candidatus Cybelea sp.]